MATIFHPNKPVNAKPLHHGKIIYADDTCIRAITSELLGGGGGVEILAPIFMFISIIPLAWFWFVEGKLDTFSLYPLGAGLLFLILPIIIFRYKPNYLIFSRKSQEIYYVRSPKNIITFKWSEVKAEYRRVAVFSGSTVSQMEVLHLIGQNQYNDKQSSAVIAFVVADEETANEFWAYLQAYMKHGAEGLEKPRYDKFNQSSFISEAKAQTKMWLYDLPRSLSSIFSPKTYTQVLFSIFAIIIFPIFYFFLLIPFLWPGQIATAFVGSTRKRAPFPEDLLPYITDNPESWGKEK